MPWTVRLQDERGLPAEVADSVVDFDLPSRGLLKYVDPYGDTIFNRVQMEDFINDWKMIEPADSVKRQAWQQVHEMATRCNNESHLYIKFIGD